jgi:cold shock CspA family protein
MALPAAVHGFTGVSGQMPPTQMAPEYSGFQGVSEGATYNGFVKAYHNDKGWGHIQCEETQRIYGKDIFFMRSGIRGGRLEIGHRVTFSITMTDRGPQAEQVRTQEQMGEAVVNAEAVGKMYSGKIKKYEQTKGWGFIESDATFQIFGKDVFVHKRDTGDNTYHAGDVVQFSVVLGNDGRPEARGVFLISKSPDAPANPVGVGGLSVNTAKSSPPIDPNRTYFGVLKLFETERAYGSIGYISCDETYSVLGKDIHVHKNDCLHPGLINDDIVKFAVTLGLGARPEAKRISRCSAEERAQGELEAASQLAWLSYMQQTQQTDPSLPMGALPTNNAPASAMPVMAQGFGALPSNFATQARSMPY